MKQIKISLLLLAVFCFYINPVSAQVFTEQTDIVLPGISNGSVVWGDYDNDGDLDLLLAGEYAFALYRNEGENSFVEMTQTSLPSRGYLGRVDWGDYDNDGDLDILLSGVSAEKMTRVYKNNGDGSTFTWQEDILLPGAWHSSVTWGDMDNDGDLDIAINGIDESDNQFSKIYRNDQQNVFIEIPIEIPPISDGDINWGDYNNDNLLDLLITGKDNSGNSIAKVYCNNGDETFTNIKANLIGAEGGSAAWGDYDNDGDLDILMSGSNYKEGPFSIVYENSSDNSFIENSATSLPGLRLCSVAWGDYNNDGLMDIVISGYGNTDLISRIYKNNGDCTFAWQEDISLPGVRGSSVAWVDYDNDGDLDLLLCGRTDSGSQVSKIYKNNTVVPNLEPAAPANLRSKTSAASALLSWSKSKDTETLSDGLTYNVVISTSSQSCEILSPMSDSATGFRRIVGHGNAYCDTTFYIAKLDTGKYYWRVQAIDQSFAGSEFSDVDSFTILPEFTEINADIGYWFGGTATWGDYDNDGDLDILSAGLDGNTVNATTRIYKNVGDDIFVEQSSIRLKGIYYGSVDWNDYNLDGYLDILLTGKDSLEESVVFLYKNNGDDSTFTWQEDILLPGIYNSDAGWGDYNNDGDPDILLTGLGESGRITRIYNNNGDNSFTEHPGISLPDLYGSSVAWGDYDNDTDLDIFLLGTSSGCISKIFRNDGENSFSECTNLSFEGVDIGSVAWGDYDSDGDLDILLMGKNTAWDAITRIYRNDRYNTFTDIDVNIRGFKQGESLWGDYDNDGDLDILIGGVSGTEITEIYRNDINGQFSKVETEISGIAYGSGKWGDYDNDGDLDILVSGRGPDGYRTIIYKNNWNVENSQPTAPNNLQAMRSGYGILLSWDSSSDDKTDSKSLTYNLRLGSESDSADIIYPLCDIETGYVKVPQMGYCNLNTKWRIDSLAEGTYYWSVQAVDNTFLGGEWAEEQSFVVSTLLADFDADTVCEGLVTSFNDLSLSTGEPITEWAWDFGDGVLSSLQNPDHLFAKADTIEVQLVVKSVQHSDTLSKEVIVKPIPLPEFSSDIVCQGISTNFINLTNLTGLEIDSWSWDFGDENTSVLQNPESHRYFESGDYQVELYTKAKNGCINTISKIVSVGENPVAAITSNGKTELCAGDSLVLSNFSYRTSYQYQWAIGGAIQTSTDSSDYIAKTDGTYTVEVTNLIGNCTTLSEPFLLQVNPLPAIPVIQTENYLLDACQDENPVTLSVETEQAGVVYQWRRNGVPISGENCGTFTGFLEEGDYTVIANNQSCITESQVLKIKYGEAPDKPNIFAEGPNIWYLACSNDSASDYKWFLNDELIEGVNDYLYVSGSQEGKFEVAISINNSCFAKSDPVWIPLGTGIETDPWEHLKIYPNPSPGLFTLEMNNAIMGELIIDIFGETGAQIINIKFQKETVHFKTQIDLSGQPAGLYLIDLMLEQYKTTRKLIVE